MKFGHFDDKAREYVIDTPRTPYPWINYLGCEKFFGIISNTAGGYCFYRDARLRRITRYRYNNMPVDNGGRYFYINDNGTVWNPGWKPVKTELDEYSCRHGMGYTIITGKKNGLKASQKSFVPMGCDAEVCLPAVGAETTLSVVITAEETETISCRWYNDENPDDTLSEGETLVVSEEGSYSCTVSDDRGHSETVSFYVFISGFDPDFLREHAVPVSAGQETAASIDTSNDIAIFSFTTEETGTYTATAITDPGKYLSAELLNAEGYLLCADEYNGAQSNFGITWDMEAGETYYLIVNYRDDSVGDFLLLLASPLDNNLWINLYPLDLSCSSEHIRTTMREELQPP